MADDPFARLGAVDQQLFQPKPPAAQPAKPSTAPKRTQPIKPAAHAEPSPPPPSEPLSTHPALAADAPTVEKYSTQLLPETIKAIKTMAVECGKRDYQIVQEALDDYFISHKS